MASRARPTLPRLLLGAATASYGASCALGASVASGWLDTRGFRWLHHVLYGATTALTGTAVVALTARHEAAGWALLPALGPLAVLPRTRGRTPRHAQTALAAAPFFVLALRRAGR